LGLERNKPFDKVSKAENRGFFFLIALYGHETTYFNLFLAASDGFDAIFQRKGAWSILLSAKSRFSHGFWLLWKYFYTLCNNLHSDEVIYTGESRWQ